MKQHITVKQLNELGEKEKKRLLKWQVEKHYAKNVFEYSSFNGSLSAARTGRYEVKTLSIGQMIEFIGKRWYLYGRTDDYNHLVLEVHQENIDAICDILWEQVKLLLEDDEENL